MSPLMCDFAERFVLSCLAAIALIAGLAGAVALPLSGLLIEAQPAAGSQPAAPMLLGFVPWLLTLGAGSVCYAAVSERWRSRSRWQTAEIVESTRPKSTLALAMLAFLPGPALVVTPLLVRWIGNANVGLMPAGEWSIVFAPFWVPVLVPAASLIGAAVTLAVAGPLALILYIGGSHRASRILLLFWALQFVLMASSYPFLQHVRTNNAAQPIGFVSLLLFVVFAAYSVPVYVLWRERWVPSPVAAAQGGGAVVAADAGGPVIAHVVEPLLPGGGFLLRKAGGWEKWIRILPPRYEVLMEGDGERPSARLDIVPELNLAGPNYRIEQQGRAVCRIRRNVTWLATTGYSVDGINPAGHLFSFGRVTANGANWEVTENGCPVATLTLCRSDIGAVDFDRAVGGIPAVNYFWRANVMCPDVSAERTSAVSEPVSPLLAIAAAVVVADILPRGLSHRFPS